MKLDLCVLNLSLFLLKSSGVQKDPSKVLFNLFVAVLRSLVTYYFDLTLALATVLMFDDDSVGRTE